MANWPNDNKHAEVNTENLEGKHFAMAVNIHTPRNVGTHQYSGSNANM